MNEEKRRPGIGGIGDGIRTGIGILNAFREAIEETLEEAVKRGELSPERAGNAVRDAAQRVQDSFEGARDRFDFVSRREYDDLKSELDALRARVSRLEGGPAASTDPPPGIIITE